jgi:hypothetical protein
MLSHISWDPSLCFGSAEVQGLKAVNSPIFFLSFSMPLVVSLWLSLSVVCDYICYQTIRLEIGHNPEFDALLLWIRITDF